jgi:hypothetical protein
MAELQSTTSTSLNCDSAMADPKVASNFDGILADPVLSLHKCDRGTMLPIHTHSAVDQVGLRSCHSATFLADVPVFMLSTGNNSCTFNGLNGLLRSVEKDGLSQSHGPWCGKKGSS